MSRQIFFFGVILGLLCAAAFPSVSFGATMQQQPANFVLGPFCCPHCSVEPFGCCCARGDAVPATIWTTKTGTAKRTRTVVQVKTRTTTVTVAALAGRGMRVGKSRPQIIQPEPESNGISARDSDKSEVATGEAASGRLLRRNLCPVCPAGAVFGTSGETHLQPCCRHRRTVVRTKTKSATKVVTVTHRRTKTVTVLQVLVPRVGTARNGCKEGTNQTQN